MSLESYQQIAKEREELVDKAHNLYVRINRIELEQIEKPIDYDLLKQQLEIMINYQYILDLRIERFNSVQLD